MTEAKPDSPDSQFRKYFSTISAFIVAIDKVICDTANSSCGGIGQDARYALEKLERYVSALEHLAKFKVGQRVKLVRDWVLEEGSGWRGYAPSFKRGSIAIIDQVDWSADSKQFVYGIIFDQQFWTSSMDGLTHKSDDDDKSLFCGIPENEFVAEDAPLDINYLPLTDKQKQLLRVIFHPKDK